MGFLHCSELIKPRRNNTHVTLNSGLNYKISLVFTLLLYSSQHQGIFHHLFWSCPACLFSWDDHLSFVLRVYTIVSGVWRCAVHGGLYWPSTLFDFMFFNQTDEKLPIEPNSALNLLVPTVFTTSIIFKVSEHESHRYTRPPIKYFNYVGRPHSTQTYLPISFLSTYGTYSLTQKFLIQPRWKIFVYLQQPVQF